MVMNTTRPEDQRPEEQIGHPQDMEAPERAERGVRSIPRLLRELAAESTELVQGEVALAKAEMSEKVQQAQRATVSMMAGGAVLFTGAIFLLLAVMFALAVAMPAWAAALIVGGATVIVGGLMVFGGKKELQPRRLQPRRTIDEGIKTKNLIKEQVS